MIITSNLNRDKFWEARGGTATLTVDEINKIWTLENDGIGNNYSYLNVRLPKLSMLDTVELYFTAETNDRIIVSLEQYQENMSTLITKIWDFEIKKEENSLNQYKCKLPVRWSGCYKLCFGLPKLVAGTVIIKDIKVVVNSNSIAEDIYKEELKAVITKGAEFTVRTDYNNDNCTCTTDAETLKITFSKQLRKKSIALVNMIYHNSKFYKIKPLIITYSVNSVDIKFYNTITNEIVPITNVDGGILFSVYLK